MDAVDSGAKDKQEFCSLWKHAFLFHRCWNAVDQEFIYDHVLQNINVRDRARLKVFLDEALLEAEEAYEVKFAHIFPPGRCQKQTQSSLSVNQPE